MRLLRWTGLIILLTLLTEHAYGQTLGVISKAEAARSGDSARVFLLLNPEMLTVGEKEVLTVTPRLVAEADSVTLPAIHVLGRQTYYRYLRHDNLGLILPDDEVLWEKRRYRPYAYLHGATWQKWMDMAVLKVQIELSSCEETIGTDVTLQQPRSVGRPALPTAAIVRKASITERMTIVFELNKTDVRPELYDNQRELDKIRKSIETVESDENAELQRLTIKGYASPEGPYKNNVRLARERTDSLGAFIARRYNIDPGKVFTDYEPEDWQGLTDYISKATLEQLPHRDQLLEIARRDLPPDQKERLMRRTYPKDFDHLLTHCLPYLRHTDYRIDYLKRENVMPPTHKVAVKEMPPAPPQHYEGHYDPLRPYKALLALKTNVLFDAVLAFNAEIEVPIGRKNRWSVMGEYWTPWYVWHNNSRAYELQVFGVEARYWLGRCRERRPLLTGWFLGAYYAYGRYDFEWDTGGRIDEHGQAYNGEGNQGELNSVGISVGYCWPIARHWNLELSASLGAFSGPRRHYHGEFGDTHLIWKYNASLFYAGPTKLKCSLVWLLGKKRKGGAL